MLCNLFPGWNELLAVFGYPDSINFHSSDQMILMPNYGNKFQRCSGSRAPIFQYFCFQPKSVSSAFSLNMSSETFGDDNTPFIFVILDDLSKKSFVDIRVEIRKVDHKAECQFSQLSKTDNVLTKVSKKMFEKDHIHMIHIHNNSDMLSKLSDRAYPRLDIAMNLSVDALMEKDNESLCFEDLFWYGFLPPLSFVMNYRYILNRPTTVGKNPNQVFLTQGRVKNVTYSCEINNTCNPEISWIEQDFRPYVLHKAACDQSGQCVVEPSDDWMFLFQYCINFTSVSKEKNHFNLIYFSLTNIHLGQQCTDSLSPQNGFGGCVGVHQISWLEASMLCEHIGGSLPVFRSKNELNQVLFLIKYSKIIPPCEAFYIGLFQKSSVNRKCEHCGTAPKAGFVWESNEPMVFQKWQEHFRVNLK